MVSTLKAALAGAALATVASTAHASEREPSLQTLVDEFHNSCYTAVVDDRQYLTLDDTNTDQIVGPILDSVQKLSQATYGGEHKETDITVTFRRGDGTPKKMHLAYKDLFQTYASEGHAQCSWFMQMGAADEGSLGYQNRVQQLKESSAPRSTAFWSLVSSHSQNAAHLTDSALRYLQMGRDSIRRFIGERRAEHFGYGS